jgi:hypothetical protein
MSDQATLQTIAGQSERGIDKLDIARGKLTVLTGMAMQVEARINGLVAEMREWRQSRSDDHEPQHER